MVSIAPHDMTHTQEAILQVDQIHKTYPSTTGAGEREVLRDVSFDIAPGEFVSLIGASGCGKTTLLKIVGGLIPATSGSVQIEETRVSRPLPDRTAVVFQEDALLPWLTIEKNVAIGLEAAKVRKEDIDSRVTDWIKRVGLDGYQDSYPHQLSGGMRQRAALARGLVMNPRLLLLDEPLGALDEQTRNIMAYELRNLHLRLGGAMLMITHSLTEAVLISDRVVVLATRPGRVSKVLEVPLGRERNVDMVDDPEFVKLRHELWMELQDDWSSHIVEGT